MAIAATCCELVRRVFVGRFSKSQNLLDIVEVLVCACCASKLTPLVYRMEIVI